MERRVRRRVKDKRKILYLIRKFNPPTSMAG